MTKGRKPTPNALKSLRGTDQPSRMRDEISGTSISDVNQIAAINNSDMLKSKKAKDIFIQKANQLIALKILTDLDIDMLVIYANAFATYQTCQKEVKKGLFTEKVDDNNNITGYVANPYIKLEREMIEVITKIGSDFGFTPVARMKLRTEPAKEKDAFVEMMEKFNQ